MLAGGLWGIGSTAYGSRSQEDCYEMLAAAVDNGVTFFDTSDSYGDGGSEEMLGNFIEKRKVRDRVFIATKVGLLPHSGFYMPTRFDVEYVKNSLKASLDRLKTDFVDLYQFHSPERENIGQIQASYEYLSGEKQRGRVRNIGLSARSPEDALYFMEILELDYIQANFNLIDQRFIESGLYAECKKRGVRFLARTPLAFGFLTGKLTANKGQFEDGDHRKKWPQEQLDVWAAAPAKFKEIADRQGLSLLELSHAYIRYYRDVVTATITGMYTSEEVLENIEAYQKEISAGTIEELHDIYKSNTFFIRGVKEKGPQ